jgi:hypothetical protein
MPKVVAFEDLFFWFRTGMIWHSSWYTIGLMM